MLLDCVSDVGCAYEVDSITLNSPVVTRGDLDLTLTL
jgi:hypothetical protein